MEPWRCLIHWLSAPVDQKICSPVALKPGGGRQSQHFDSKASNPVRLGNLGCRLAWVKTAKSFMRFRTVSPTVFGHGIWFVALLFTEYSLQPVLNRAHRSLQSPSDSPIQSSLEQNRAYGFHHLQSKTSGLTWAENLVHTLGSQTTSCIDPGYQPAALPGQES